MPRFRNAGTRPHGPNSPMVRETACPHLAFASRLRAFVSSRLAMLSTRSFTPALFVALCTLVKAQNTPANLITVTSSTCTRPLTTVGIYTSGSSTYIVENLGTASLCYPTDLTTLAAPSAAPTSTPLCVPTTVTSFSLGANVSCPAIEPTSCPSNAILTETLTVISTAVATNGVPTSNIGNSLSSELSPPTPQPTAETVVAIPSNLQQQGSGSRPYVTAEVVNPADTPPIAKPGDSDFLLVTFGSSTTGAPSSDRHKRQAGEPLVYNTTQSFASVAGGVYSLSAIAAIAQNGDMPPTCALTICARGSCGSPQSLSSSYQQYTYIYIAETTSTSDIATLSVQCTGMAYVGLDDVAVSTLRAGDPRYVFRLIFDDYSNADLPTHIV